jgi:hypothetical protein
MKPEVKRVVLSLHGIRTRGVWQKDLVPILARNDFVPIPLDYGDFSVMQLLSASARRKKVDWLREKIECIPEVQQGQRLSIIAHSFGTYIVAELIRKYPMLRFDKVIFAGRIVREDYDWPKVLSSKQVNLFRNDYGHLDPWPRLAKKLIPDAGNSGECGFSKTPEEMKHLMVARQFLGYGHSDYFHAAHFLQEWVPTLKTIVLENGIVIDQTVQSNVVETMSLAVQTVEQRLKIDRGILRANIFVKDDTGRLSIPPGLHYNMKNLQELTISIPIGTGCTGRAYSDGEYAIAVFDQGWGQYTLPLPQLEKVDRGLRWIFSMPIPDTRNAQDLLGILNVDCLIVFKTFDEIHSLQEDIKWYAQRIAKQLTGV